MMGSVRDYLFVILFHGILWMDCMSALTVTPKLTSVVVGDSVAITCNKAPNAVYPVDWKHRPVGANDPIHFYSKAAAGFKEQYRADFSVDENNALGQYSLLIKNVKSDYAGAYFCVDNDPYSTTETAELVVIVTSPECSSNVSKDGAVGENTCNIEPDVVEMTCSVKYQGNSSPSLAWKDEGTKTAIQSGVSSTSEPTRSNITLVMKANSTLNQRSFYCVVVNTQTLSNNYSCSGTKIKVMYAVNTESKQRPNEDGEIECAANTSQTPSFEWKSDVGFDNKFRTLKIDSNKNTFKRLQCFVHYTIRQKNCTLMSTIVSEEGMMLFMSPCPGCGSAIAAAVIVPLLLVIIFIAVVYFAYKKAWLNKSEIRRTFGGLFGINNSREKNTVMTIEDKDYEEESLAVLLSGRENECMIQVEEKTDDKKRPWFDRIFVRLQVNVRPTKDFAKQIPSILIEGFKQEFGSGTQITGIFSTRRNVLFGISYPEENRKQVDDSIESGKVSAAIRNLIQKCSDQTFKHSRHTELFRYSGIRNNLIKAVFPESEKGSIQDKYFNSGTALELYLELLMNPVVTKDAKEEIDGMKRSSNNAEKMKRFRTLLETEGNGVLEATVDHFMKDDYDVAASLKLIDSGFDLVFLRFSVGKYPIPAADSFQKLSAFLRHRTCDQQLKNISIEKLESTIGPDAKIISAHSIINSVLLGIACSNKIGREFESSVQGFLQQCMDPAVTCSDFSLIDFGKIRRRLLNVVYPDKRNESSNDGHAHSKAKVDNALLAYCKKDFITDEAKQEIQAIEGSIERRRRFKRLLEAGDNGVLESSVEFIIKTEFDTAVDILLTDISLSFHRRLDCTKNVMGVAASKDHIAVICQQSDEVLLFDNGKETEVRRLKISGMQRPWDVITYKSSIVVSDEESKCLWKIDDWEDHLKYHSKQYPDISKNYRLGVLARKLDGTFMVRMTKEEQSKWKDIKKLNAKKHSNHVFDSNFRNPYHFAPYVEDKSYAVLHMKDATSSTRSVDLVRSDGKLHDLSFFIHKLCDEVHLNKPESVAVDEDGRIFIADCNNCRIVVIQGGRSISVVKLGENERPHKLCYVPERRQLIVGLVSNVVLVFNLSPK